MMKYTIVGGAGVEPAWPIFRICLSAYSIFSSPVRGYPPKVGDTSPIYQ